MIRNTQSKKHSAAPCYQVPDLPDGMCSTARPQLTAFFTSSPIFASSAAVNSFSAKATGHKAPSSRFALSLKPNVAYLVLNLCAGWKKQTTLPSLAYAGIPYQSFGERAGALALIDRKSTRLNSSHVEISYAVFCLKKKTCARSDQRLRQAPRRSALRA